jgi:tetratricopeptide (TPR) repeat protein
MRAYVFTDEALASHAGQFVWFGMDVDKAENASLREKFPSRALPTYFIVNPRDESVALRWVGGATVPQLQQILDDGLLAVAGGAGKGDLEVDRTLARADLLYGEGKNAEAAEEYARALTQSPEDWRQEGRAVESLLLALYLEGDYQRAAMLAQGAYPDLRGTTSAVNVTVTGLDCALSISGDDPHRQFLVDGLEQAAREVLADPDIVTAADDKSSLYGVLVSAREEAGDEEGAREVAIEWAAFLEDAAAAAETPEQRAVYDSHRLSVYLELGEPERAVPMLEQSERDFPEDYNPPGRIAVAYKEMKRWEDALAASDRAIEKSYGPRQLRYISNKAAIYEDSGDIESAKRTLEEAIARAEALPEGQRSESRTARLKDKLASLD